MNSLLSRTLSVWVMELKACRCGVKDSDGWFNTPPTRFFWERGWEESSTTRATEQLRKQKQSKSLIKLG